MSVPPRVRKALKILTDYRMHPIKICPGCGIVFEARLGNQRTCGKARCQRRLQRHPPRHRERLNAPATSSSLD